MLHVVVVVAVASKFARCFVYTVNSWCATAGGLRTQYEYKRPKRGSGCGRFAGWKLLAWCVQSVRRSHSCRKERNKRGLSVSFRFSFSGSVIGSKHKKKNTDRVLRRSADFPLIFPLLSAWVVGERSGKPRVRRRVATSSGRFVRFQCGKRCGKVVLQ